MGWAPVGPGPGPIYYSASTSVHFAKSLRFDLSHPRALQSSITLEFSKQKPVQCREYNSVTDGVFQLILSLSNERFGD